jgi:hypothetical protein
MVVTPEVKGVWFVTARRHILESFGDGKLVEFVAALPIDLRPVMTEPMASAWYHEDVFQQVLATTMKVVCDDDPKRFCAFIEACTVLGVHAFFRVLLRIPSTAFLMRKMPVLSRQYRRNDSDCTVEADHTEATLRYTNMPYFADPNYRLYAVSMLIKTAELCSRTRPRAEILDHTNTSLTVRVRYG